MNANKPNAYETITERIIAALEAGTAPWKKPWMSAGAARSIDGRFYRGINQFLLQLKKTILYFMHMRKNIPRLNRTINLTQQLDTVPLRIHFQEVAVVFLYIRHKCQKIFVLILNHTPHLPFCLK